MAAVPAVLTVRDATAQAVGEASEPEPEPQTDDATGQATADLIVRWEIGSRARYQAGVTCPGGGSGPTIGIGYDLGTQTAAQIARDWAWHPAVDTLVTASGKVGPAACAAWRKAHPGIRVEYEVALNVFRMHDLPRYRAMAARSYANGWAGLSGWHQGGLVSNGYNRGFSVLGERRREMRAIRDDCVPAGDAGCSAEQLRASCRVWKGTPIYAGLCSRRKDEARFVVRAEK